MPPNSLPQVFGAQFSLSHVASLITYPIAGYVSTAAGFTVPWSILLALAVAGSLAALALWPSHTQADVSIQAAARSEQAADYAESTDVPAGRGPAVISAAGTLAAAQCACVRPL